MKIPGDRGGGHVDRFRETYLKDIRGTVSDSLAGRRIVVGVTGSIAAVEVPRLVRELMRRGADVWACLTPSAARIVTPQALEWATGNPVYTELGGWVEHLLLAGDWEGRADLLLVAPATANTVGKMAHGIDDTVVTTVATTALGCGVPVLVAPGMHAVMAEHPAFVENLARLRSFGVEIVDPVVAEAKAKMASVETLVEAVERRLGPRPLDGKRVLITAGPTVEYLDPVRVVTNLSSGRMGVALAEEALRLGARVTLVYGPGSANPPARAEVIRVMTTDQMREAVRASLEAEDAASSIFAAAVSDYRPAAPESEKVPTDRGSWTVALEPTPKILQDARAWTRGLVVSFKAETTDSDEALLATARAHQSASGADITVANRVGQGRGFLEPTNEVYILDGKSDPVFVPMSSKQEVARHIWSAILAHLPP